MKKHINTFTKQSVMSENRNKYHLEFCTKCNKETNHNFRSCMLCASKKYYYENHKRMLDRGIKRYRENYTPSMRYSQKKTQATRKGHKMIITREEFVTWYNSVEKVCHYCNCTLQDWLDMKINQHRNFTIDRMDNAKEYEAGNLCLACHRCNTLKRSRDYAFFKKKWRELHRQIYGKCWDE